MPSVRANGIEIAYETFGRPNDRPLLMITGLGMQMLQWDEPFCEALAARGHFAIRFDNRDTGLSSSFDHAGVPDLGALMKPGADRSGVPYTLDDMADDAAGLMAALGIESAHVFGASMGGMIAQTLAFRHAPRVRSLVSLYSSTGNPALPPAKPEAMAVLLAPRPAERAGAIEAAVATAHATSGPGYPIDADHIRAKATRMFDRAHRPHAAARHLAAITAQGNRCARLAGVTAPTLVLHGSADPLVPVEGGRDTAKCIPGAQLIEIDGLGHGIPRVLWERFADLVAAHTAKAEAARSR
jgi:pimeloyl-ACP methyl ester carboxylesterase